MRVLVYCEGITPGRHGGVENFIYSLCRGFNHACADVELLLQVSPGATVGFQQVLFGARVTYLEDAWFGKMEAWCGKSRALRFAWRIVVASRIGSWLRAYRARKWHEHCQTLVDVVLYPTRRLPVLHRSKPVVMTLHDLRWFERAETGARLQKLLRHEPIAAVVTAWPDPFAILSRLFPELYESCFMVPFVMDPSPPDHLVNTKSIPRTLLYTSDNGREKNHEVLIRALGILRRRGVPPVYVICTGPVLPERVEVLDALILGEGVRDWIFFLGWLPREFVLWLYQNVSGVITTSTHEAMSGTVMEGWQYGKPAACSRIPSIQALTDLLDVEVRFFDHNDPEDVALAIEELLEHPDRYRRGAVRARACLSRITQEATALQYRDILSWACGLSEKPGWHPYREWWL